MEWSTVSTVVLLTLGLALMAVLVIALLQASAAPAISAVERVIWIALIFFVPYIGAIAWFLYGRPRSRRLASGQPLTPTEQGADRLRRAILDRASR